MSFKNITIKVTMASALAVLSVFSCSCASGGAAQAPDEPGYVPPAKVYVQTTASLIDVDSTSHICGLAKRGDSLEVVGYDRLEDGVPHRFLVKQGKHQGYIYTKYTVDSLHLATDEYLTHELDSAHRSVKNRFKGGEAIGCDFRYYERPKNIYKGMPSPVNAFYLNISPGNLKKIDDYIRLADSTKINAFVLDMKDCECPGYKAEAMRLYSPTNYSHASGTQDKLYEEVVKKLHDHGYWVIGRITCFKDTYYAKDHPEATITSRATGQPFYHNKSYWPSAYNRGVWQFNVELAKESVRRFGLDEINFDYVRFPDRLTSKENEIDFHNTYGESKVQAIQNFVRYATDELHELGVPVSIDVFGESANPGYTTAYGQYWPAISNVADVICAMPYPDHFSDGYYGIDKPWNHPYELLLAWGKRAAARQEQTANPARVRTWIQAYHIMKHVDANGIDNNSDFVIRQIRGLYDAGLKDGYTTWNASGTISMYRKQKTAYATDFPALPPFRQ